MSCGEGGGMVGGLACLHNVYLPCFALGVVEEGGGRASTGKVSKIAGMFQSGGGVRVEEPASTTTSSTTGSSSSSSEGPQHATVVRTESHLARFNNARALFEKMGQGEAMPLRRTSTHTKYTPPGPSPVSTSASAPALAPVSVVPPSKPTPAVRPDIKVVSRLQANLDSGAGGDGGRRTLGLGSTSERVRAESVSPARSSSTSSRSPSPGAPRTANGHAPHHPPAVVPGVRRPGSTSSTDSEPPRRWPPEPPPGGDEALGRVGRGRPEPQVKPQGVEVRRVSPHEQHQELLARHRNWFQSFTKSRSPTKSELPTAIHTHTRTHTPLPIDLPPPPSAFAGDPTPSSPTKAEAPPSSPTRTDWRTTYTSRLDLKSPRGGTEETEGRARGRDEGEVRSRVREEGDGRARHREEAEDRARTQPEGDGRTRLREEPEGRTRGARDDSSEGKTRLRDETEGRARLREEAEGRKRLREDSEGRTRQREDSSEGRTTRFREETEVKKRLREEGEGKVARARDETEESSSSGSSTSSRTTTTTTTTTTGSTGSSSSEQEAWSTVLQSRYGPRARQDLLSSRPRVGGEGETSDWRKERAAILAGRSGQRHSGSEDEVKSHARSQQEQQQHHPPGGGGGGGVSCVSSRFEDTATLQSHWAPPHQYGQQHQQEDVIKVDTHSETSSITTTATSSSTTSQENQSEVASSLVSSSRKSHHSESSSTTPPPHRSPSESSTSSRRSHHSDTSSTTTTTTTSSRKVPSESSVSSRKSHSESSTSSSHENQSEAEEPRAKTLKDVNNVAQTERLKTSRTVAGGVGLTENGISTTGGIRENGSSRGVESGETCEKLASVVLAVEKKKEETDLIVTESVVLKDSVKEKDIEQQVVKSDSEIRESEKEKDFEKKAESIAKSDYSEVYSPERRKLGKSKEKSEVVNARLKETILGESEVTEKKDYRRELEERRIRREERVERRKEELLVEGRRRREREWSHRGVRGKYGEVRERESSEESEARRKDRSDEGRGRARNRESSEEDGRDVSEERVRPLRRSREARPRDKRGEEREATVVRSVVEDKERIIVESEVTKQTTDTVTPTATTTPSSKPTLPRQTTPPTPDSSSAADVVVGGVVNVLKAETVYVSSSEDISQLDDSRKEQLKLESPEGKIKEDQDIKEKEKGEEEEEKEEEEEEVVEVVEKKKGEVDPSTVRRQLFPDVVSGTCEGKVLETDLRKPSEEEVGDTLLEEEGKQQQEEKAAVLQEKKVVQEAKEEKEEKGWPIDKEISVQDVPGSSQEKGEDRGEAEGPTIITPPLSPRAHSLAALDALIHGRPQEAAPAPAGTRATTQEEDEIMYDHTVTSAQHKIQFCTTPVTVEGFPDSRREDNSTGTSSHDSDPEPLPPPIPPHGTDPATVITAPIRPDTSESISPHAINNNVMVVGRAGSTSPSPDNNNILLPRADSPTRAPSPPTLVSTDPEVMTADEAQRLLSSKESQGLLSDEEAQEVVLLLSPPHQSPQDPSPCLPPPPPPVPPHTQDPGLMKGDGRFDLESAFDSGFASETVTRYDPDTTFEPAPGYESTDKFDPTVGAFNPSVAYDPAAKLDQTLASPLSPEDEPSEADSSEASGDITQVTRVKEVLVEDGVHYLEDGHFWVEVPGLAEEWEDEDDDPNMPFHPHTRLTFSTRPVQVFSTYSVTEYDRKNDEVDPVAASAEYELEKRVEKMDLFPVQILKGEGGLGLSIIGMGVGADAGVEKLGIFVKTITPGGATQRDGRIQVNDQIIEVDGKSLVGVTQVFAASVLKNTSGEVNFLIGREKDPENSEVALLIKQSLQADREREERRRALGGPDYDPHTGQVLFDPLSSPSEENSRSEDVPPHHHHHHHHHPHYPGYMEGMGQSPPTSPDATSPPPEVYDLEGDTSDNSSDADTAMLRKKLKEYQYRNAVAEAEVAKLKMSLVEMERKMGEGWAEGQGRLQEADRRAAELDGKLAAKSAEVSTYQDMLEQSQGQFIILEKKYNKAKKIIKEYQGREQDFQHREEYHITLLEEKDSHYNALVKALKDRVIQLEGELVSAQKTAGLPVQVPPTDPSHPTHWHPPQPQTTTKQPPRKPSLCTLASDLSDTENSDTGTSDGHKANTVERKLPVKEELDEAVPPHELLDVSASRAKGELAARGGLANRHLPSLKKTTSMSSAGSQDHSLDDSSLDDELPESQKYQQAVVGPPEVIQQEAEQDSRRSGMGESTVPSHVPTSSSVVSAKAAPALSQPALHPPSHSQTSQQHSSLSQPTQVIPSHAQPSQHPPAHSQLTHHALAYSQSSQNTPSHSQPISSHPPPPLSQQLLPGHTQPQTHTHNVPSHTQPFPGHTQVSQAHSGHSQPSKTPQQVSQLPPAHSQPSPITPSHPLPSHPPPSYQQSSVGHQQPPPSYSQSSQQYPSQSQPSPSPPQAFAQPPLPSYTQATMSSHLTSHHPPPPPYHPPPRQPHPPRPDIPYRHPPPVARVGPVNRAEGSDAGHVPPTTPTQQQQQQQHSSAPSLASHLASRTPQQQSLAEQLKALLAEREVDNEGTGVMRRERDASPSKRSPTSLIEDVRQAVMQADVSSLHHHHHHHHHLATSSSTTTSSTHQISSPTCSTSTSSSISAISPQRAPSAFYPPAGRESLRERDGTREGGTGGSPPSPKPTRSTPTAPHHPSPVAVSPNPSGVVLLSQRPLDSSHKLVPGIGEGGGGSSGDLSSGPASLGSGDEGSGASLGGSQTSLTPPDRSRRAHMWQTAPVVDWTKEQVGQWLVVQGLEGCVGRFIEMGMTGPRLLNLDLRDLKSLHLPQDDKTKLKRKVKELRLAVEKERKQAEKEKKEREKLQKKAEKLAEKAERKKK